VRDPDVVAGLRSMPEADTGTVNSADEDALATLASLTTNPLDGA
jgi:hypothetical protein